MLWIIGFCAIYQSINQSIKTNKFLSLIKRYSNIYYSATMNIYLYIWDKLSHLVTELLRKPI